MVFVSGPRAADLRQGSLDLHDAPEHEPSTIENLDTNSSENHASNRSAPADSARPAPLLLPAAATPVGVVLRVKVKRGIGKPRPVVGSASEFTHL